MSDSVLKGLVASRTFAFIAILIISVFLLAVWLLLHYGLLDYLVREINSQQRICETFEKQPLFGMVRCPS